MVIVPGMRLLAKSLRRALSGERIDKAFDTLEPLAPREPATDAPVTVSAVQAQARVFPSLADFVRATDGYFAHARAEGARLVCFPELYGMLLLGLLPPVRFALRVMSRTAAQSEPAPRSGTLSLNVPGLLAPLEFLPQRYCAVMARFARRYGVYVSCGTLLAPEQGKLYNRHVLLDPSGAEIGRADKIHLTVEETAMGLSPGAELPVIPTPIGSIALMVCMDATYFETFRVAKSLGADYAVVPIGDMAAFDPWLALRGAQLRAVETNLTAVKAALTSAPEFPLLFTGRAGVYFPYGGPPDIESADPRGKGVVTAALNLAALRALNPDPFCRANPALDARAASILSETANRGEKIE